MENNYNKKIKMCEKLGAKQFQKFFFFIEDKKWALLSKSKKYIYFGDKIIGRKKNKLLKKVKTAQEKEDIISIATIQKALLRKEKNNNENINYHIDPKRPSEFFAYLNWNKMVHKEGLKTNAILIPLFISGIIACNNLVNPGSLSTLLNGLFSTGLVIEGLSTFINLECINVQNYNTYRLKKIEKRLEEKEQKIEAEEIKKYGKAYEKIEETMDNKKDLPNIDEIINNINDKEVLMRLKERIKEEQKARENRSKNKVKIKGGK